jgi:hypothetical protein
MLEFKYIITKKNVSAFKGKSVYGKHHEVGDKAVFLMIQTEENKNATKFEVVQLFEVEKEMFLNEYEFVEKKDVFCVFKKKEM